MLYEENEKAVRKYRGVVVRFKRDSRSRCFPIVLKEEIINHDFSTLLQKSGRIPISAFLWLRNPKQYVYIENLPVLADLLIPMRSALVYSELNVVQ